MRHGTHTAFLSIGGLFVVYLAALTALAVRRTVSWTLSAVRDRNA